MIDLINQYKSDEYSFQIGNLEYWKGHIDCTQRSNIFITPRGQYAVTAYNQDNEEYFDCFDDLQHFKHKCIDEKIRYFNRCNSCDMFQNCLSEHFYGWNNDDDECCGLYQLTKMAR